MKMFLRWIFLSVTILSLIISSEEQKPGRLPRCKELPFNHDFSYNFNEFAWNMWMAASLNIPQEQNLIIYPYNLLRLFAIMYSGSINPTRAEFQNAAKRNLNQTLQDIERYVTCYKTQKFHKNFKVKEMGYFGLHMSEITPFYRLIAEWNYGIDFWKKAPYRLTNEVKSKLTDDAKKLTNKKMEKFFDPPKVMKDGLKEGFIYGSHQLKLKWNTPFSDTENGHFCTFPPQNKTIKAKIMKIQAEFPRAEKNFRNVLDFVEVPFEEKRYTMFVIVPGHRKAYKTVLESLKDKGMWYLMDDDPPRKNVTLRFPKFKIDFKNDHYDFTPVMEKVKLGSLVNKFNSWLWCISPAVYVNSIKQGTFMELGDKNFESISLINFLIYPKNKRSGRNADKPKPPIPKPPEFELPTNPKLQDCILLKPPPEIQFPDIDIEVPGAEMPELPIPPIPVQKTKDQNDDHVKGQPDDNSKTPDERIKHRKDRGNIVINATKPFMFAIVDRFAKIPLIFGKIAMPKEK